MGLLQENLSKHENNFENTKFNNFSWLRTPDILMNIISCHGLVNYSIPKVILKFRSDLVTYYISKGFVIVETEEGVIDNTPTNVNIKIHDDSLHPEDSSSTQSGISINCQYIKKIIISRDVVKNYASNFYDYHHIEFYTLEVFCQRAS